jgi:SPP1 gp7 family putative phage head morphogenesis protein
MATVNEELLESAIFRSLAQRGISDDIAEEIVRLITDKVLPDIAKRTQDLPFNSLNAGDFRLIQLKNAIEEGMDWTRVTSTLNSRLRNMMVDEAGIAVQQLDEVTPLALGFLTPGPDLLTSLVMERPFNDKLMSEWFDKLGTDTQNMIYDAFETDMFEGKSIPKMAADLLEKDYDAFTTGGVNKAINNAKSVARTAANMVQNRARETVYEANSDIVAGVEYVATLDDRTTDICMALHGNVYAVGEGARPPQHYNCRSTTVPVLKSWQELGINQADLTKRQQASMDGRAAKVRSFDDWLKTKDAATQNKLLGPVRAKMWRDGDVSNLSGFVDSQGHTIPLKDFGLNRAGNPLQEATA